MIFDVVQLLKVYEPRTSFLGCLFKVVYNGVPLSLWPSLFTNESRAICCRKPSTVFPSPVPTLSAVTFYGFGYLSYNDQTLPQFTDSLGLKLKFRTFAPDAVILLLTSADSNVADYCGIFLNDGKLRWHVVSGGNSVSIESREVIYNSGNWYEVINTFLSVKNYVFKELMLQKQGTRGL